MKDYAGYSLWLSDVSLDLTPRAPLPGSRDVDVAIVGAGYTGLWTAYYLLGADPSLRIALIEKEIAGFGASGRNGGWCSALFAAGHAAIARRRGRAAAIAMQRAMFESVDEIGRVVGEESIDANWHKGGTLTLATASTHVERVRDEVAEERAWGFGEDDYRWLDPSEARRRLDTAGLLGAAYTPHCARLHPARLARGLAGVVEDRGALIYEETQATAIEPRRVLTQHGTVRAEVVVRATEGYTPRLAGQRRTLMPIYSLMIATEPLPRSFWDAVGWSNYETVTDGRHLLIYAQRTADDRIAIGGRGAPYHYGSRIDDSFDRHAPVFEELGRVVNTLWPQARGARITHTWGGPLGVPRDWHSSVGYERATGLAWAGGYVGDGVSTSNLAGRTLADLIMGRDSALVRLPWVGHRSRRWEPEPLRWLGVNIGLHLSASADRAEARTGRRARRGDIVKRMTGQH